MADRTVRAVFEAKVDQAKKAMQSLGKDVEATGKDVDGLSKDLKGLDAQKVKPDIDLEIDDAKKRLSDLVGELADLKSMEASPEVDIEIDRVKGQIKDVRGEIKDLTGQKAEVKLDLAAKDAQKRIKEITAELGDLRTLEVTPEVEVNIKDARKRLREARAELKDLNSAKAEMKVTADTSAVDSAFDGVGDAGEEAGDEAGESMAGGIIGSLKSIPIAGAVVGIGAAIGLALFKGIQDGLQIEAGRDFFSAQTGLDETTAARFARAAGEAYAQTFGESVEANMDTASMALRAGIIDSESTDREIQNVIEKLTGIQTLFEYDVAESVRGVGNLMKTGLVKDADEAFDLITAASQKIPSDDLMDTLTEYSSLFGPLGLSAQDAFGLIVQGAEAGARDTDKVADSMKELGLRIREGTDPAIEALEDLDLNARGIQKAFQEGGPKARAALGEVFDALRDLDDKGGNTQQVIANLFGGPGEDLGAALFALDIGKVNEALGGTEGAVGAADRALQTMTENTAAEMEKAKRNVEVAMNGIKGALAEAFSDDIEGAAEWVSKNRAPMIQFFLDMVDGAVAMGTSFGQGAAVVLDAIGDMAGTMGAFMVNIPGMEDAGVSMLALGGSAKEGARMMREELPSALDDVRDKIQDWAGPELLKAQVHDATVRMAEDMDEFSKHVEQSGGTVKINGETLNAEEALDVLIANIDGETGTVKIDGNDVPAENVLDVLMSTIKHSEENVQVGGDTSTARSSVRGLKADIGSTRAAVNVDADTAAAEREINELARTRYVTLGVRVSGAGSAGGMLAGLGGAHAGGRLPGLYSGGKVPGRDPGYDNVLWPLNSGGQTLAQPLAGGEWVINSRQSAMWDGLLAAINGGLRPGDLRGSGARNTYNNDVKVYGVSIPEAIRQAEDVKRKGNLSGRNTG